MDDLQSRINKYRKHFLETHDLFFEADPEPKIDYEKFEETREKFHGLMESACEDNVLKIEFENDGRSGF